VLAVSSYVRDTIVQYTDDPAHVRVLPLCLDEEVFSLDDEVVRRDDEILYVGQINLTKGVDVLLRAVRILADRGHPARLRLLGGTYYHRKRAEEARLRELATTLGLDDRVEFVGMRPPPEVAAAMRAAALVVLPSRAESFGSVLIEALACGTPVVATACGGPEDIVVDAVGRIVPPERPELLADALAGVLADRDRFAPPSLAAYAVERFGARTIVEQTLEVYRAAV
jgi:glycosyltransferase involved in cell wall biosynthesis